MCVVFFGNTKYSVIVAKALHEAFGLTAVVTIPDRLLGRKKILSPSPVKQFAVTHTIPCLTFDKLGESAIAKIGQLQPDFLVVADYGLILPQRLLTVPKNAALNVHHSLLPKYRGPSPAPTAILHGDKISGVTIIQMTDKVDAGPILAQKEYALRPDETTDSLLTTLNALGGELVVAVIANYKSITPTQQDESKASMTKRMTKEDGYIDIDNPPSPDKLDRMIRAYFPWPNVWSKANLRGQEKVIKFLPCKASPYEANFLIQVEGGKPMSLKDFLNGYPEMKQVIERLEVRG